MTIIQNPINTMCVQSIGFLYVKAGGKYTYHIAVKG